MKVLDNVSAVLKQKGIQIWSISPEATVYEALRMMADKEIGALVVMEAGQVAGIFSERDYARKVVLQGRSSQETKVSEVMNSPARTIEPDCSVDEAMHIMTERRLRHLPITNCEGALLGLVSIGDLVKWIITSHESTIEQLQSYISGQAS
jgi:CBS domain-containing protein